MKKNFCKVRRGHCLSLVWIVSFLLWGNVTMAALPIQEAKLSIQQRSVALSRVFYEIEKQTGYSFLVRNNDINMKEKVSIDPNLRFSLWDDLDQLKETVNDFLKYADIIKISDEELEFITGHTDIKDALDGLYANRAKYVIYTKGADGAEVYTRNGMVEASGYKIDVRDTTGAGDSFIGAFLYCLLNDEVEDLESVSDDTLRNYLDFANAYAANTTTKEGALAAMADRAEMDEWMKTLKK